MDLTTAIIIGMIVAQLIPPIIDFLKGYFSPQPQVQQVDLGQSMALMMKALFPMMMFMMMMNMFMGMILSFGRW